MKNFLTSRLGVTIIGYLILLLIGIVDFQTGHELSSSVLYLFPIYLIAANRYSRKTDAALIAFFCSLSWLFSELLSSYTYSNASIIYWNTLVRVITFTLISLLLYRLKKNRLHAEVMNKELEAANAEKNKFIGIAAHDIRNPLANIYNISVLMGADQTLSPKQRELVGLLNRISSSALTLLTNLLDISQIEAGSVRLNKRLQDYEAFLKEQIMLNTHLAEKKKQEIRYGGQEARLMLSFDDAHMGQVISNLVGNAIKFSQPETTIEVHVENYPDYVRTIIKDQGSGIAPQDLQKIFRPFAKGGNRPTAGESSTGLGLAIVQKLVEAHGGEVGVESTYGNGASFYFTLPKDTVQQLSVSGA